MGMPVTVEVADAGATAELIERVFAYFEYIDATFSTYKPSSEISRINRGELAIAQASADMRTIFRLAEQTRGETAGYFAIARDGGYDPSGIVKGWAIDRAADILRDGGCANFYVDAGGDVQLAGHNAEGQDWRVGIRNPFNLHEIVKALALTDCGVATSGTSIRGQHIYDPNRPGQPLTESVWIGPYPDERLEGMSVCRSTTSRARWRAARLSARWTGSTRASARAGSRWATASP